MSRSSASRAQVEPLAAIVAVFVVGVGLAVYAGTIESVLPHQSKQPAAPATLAAVEDAVTVAGVVVPTKLSAARTERPATGRLNVTLSAAGEKWHVGPTPPGTAETASERVSVRVEPGVIRSGRLTVRVWE